MTFPEDSDRCKEEFIKTGMWPNEVMYQLWRKAWAAALIDPPRVFAAANKTSSVFFAAREDAERFATSCGATAGMAVTEIAVMPSIAGVAASEKGLPNVSNKPDGENHA